jgi:hypothetical protein
MDGWIFMSERVTGWVAGWLAIPRPQNILGATNNERKRPRRSRKSAQNIHPNGILYGSKIITNHLPWPRNQIQMDDCINMFG